MAAAKASKPKNGESHGKAVNPFVMRLTDEDKARLEYVYREYVIKPPGDNPKPVDNLTEVFRYLLRREEKRLKAKPAR